jgi:hypothetical protein
MNKQKINLLITRYEAGETTLQEEQELRDLLMDKELPAFLTPYREMFGFFDQAVLEEIPNDHFNEDFFEKINEAPQEKSRVIRFRKAYSFVGLAATILILIGIYFVFQTRNQNLGTYQDPELAYAEAKKVLLAVSSNLNSGKKELSKIKELNTGMEELSNISNFNDGLKSMNKIAILDKSKNEFKR